MARMIPTALAFIPEWPEAYGIVFYVPAHLHTPGSDVPCSASCFIIF